MAIYRTVQLSFWTDSKIDDEFTPEDKYFYLFLITNHYTNISGCYEISTRQMAKLTGYNEETIQRLIKRMEEVHKVIKYDFETKEMLILNWHKYNWTKSKDLLKAVQIDADKIKSEKFKAYINTLIENGGTVPRGSIDPVGTTVTVTDTVTVSISDSVKEVIDYFNKKLGTKYTYKNKANVQAIKGRLEEGHTVDECKKVIDIKYDEWINDKEFRKYLTIETLFRPSKFEKYLNQQEGGLNGNNNWNGSSGNNQTEVRKHEYGISL